MARKMFRIGGTVINDQTNLGINGLVIQAWDNAGMLKDRFLTAGFTKGDGTFRLEFNWDDFQTLYKDARPDLFFKVFKHGHLIHSTKDITTWNIDKPDVHKEIRISPDALEWYSVSGTVTTVENMPVENMSVTAYHYAIPEPVSLGECLSGKDGSYEIDYTTVKRTSLRDTSIDLMVVCRHSYTEAPLSSQVIVDAPMNMQYSFTQLPAKLKRAPSEYEILMNDVKPLVSIEKTSQLTSDHYDYLHKKVGASIQVLKRFFYAQWCSQEAQKLGISIDAAVFYGIIENDTEPSLESIACMSKESLNERLSEQIDKNVLPQKLSRRITKSINDIRKMGEGDVISSANSTLCEILKLDKSLTSAKQKKIIQTYAACKNNNNAFFESLGQDKALKKDVAAVSNLYTLHEITGENVDLARQIHTKSTSVYEPVLWEQAQWHALLSDSAIDRPIDQDTGKPIAIEKYAAQLQDRYAEKFPMVHLAHTLEKNEVISFSDEIKAFIYSSYDFDPRTMTVKKYLDEKGVYKKFRTELNATRGKKNKELMKIAQQDRINALGRLQFAYSIVPQHDRAACASALMAIEMKIPPLSFSLQAAETAAGSTMASKTTSSTELKKKSPLLMPRILFDSKFAKKLQAVFEDDRLSSLPIYQATAAAAPTAYSTPDSALKIVSMTKADFITQWQNARLKQGYDNGAETKKEAERVYARARFAAFSFMMRAWSGAAEVNAVSPQFATSAQCYASLSQLLSSSDAAMSLADLTTLFGSFNYCECKHCQSVFSPAAYLLQIFYALAAWDEILIRRPDILLLDLNCTNTNTKLPYIDLVLEQLERLIYCTWNNFLPAQSLEEFLEAYMSVNTLNTTRGEKELALRPEHELPWAYVLLSALPFPLVLPWDKWFQEARQYLKHMGMPLYRLIETFIPVDAEYGLEPYGEYRQRQLSNEYVVRAYIGIAKPVYDIITKPFTGDDAPKTYVHLEDELYFLFRSQSAQLSDVRYLETFMNRLGLWRTNTSGDDGSADFKCARQLLGSRYVQDSRETSNLVIDICFQEDIPCDPAFATINNLNKETILRIVKFEHLRRALSWTPNELSQAIVVLSKLNLKSAQARLLLDDINEQLATQISHVQRIADGSPDISIMEILSWWGAIETGAQTWKIHPVYDGEEREEHNVSLYETLFLDASLYSIDASDDRPHESEKTYFALNAAKTELAYLDNSPEPALMTDHASVMAAVLQLNISQLGDLLEYVGPAFFDTDAGELTLSLDTLSALFRVHSLCRYCKLTLREFILLRQLTGEELNPFALAPGNTPIDTRKTVLFIELVESLQAFPFTIGDLAYMCSHMSRAETELVNQKSANFLPRLKQMLCTALEDTAQLQSFYTGDTEQNIRDMLLYIGQEESVVNIFMHSLASSDGTAPQYSRSLQSIMLRFLAPARKSEIYQSIANDPIEDRHTCVIDACLKTFAVQSVLGKELADYFNIPAEVIKTLVAIVLNSEVSADSSSPLMGWSMVPDFIDWAEGNVSDEVIQLYFKRLERIAMLLGKWDVTARELIVFRWYGIINFNRFPADATEVDTRTLKQVIELEKYIRVRKRLSVVPDDVADLVAQAHTGNIDSNRATLIHLAELCGVTADELFQAAYALDFIPDITDPRLQNKALRNADSFLAIFDVLDMARRCGCAVTNIAKWVKWHDESSGTVLRLEDSFIDASAEGFDIGFDNPHVAKVLRYKTEVVEEIRAAVKANSSSKGWEIASRDIENAMRIDQRDKLLEFLLYWPIIRYTWSNIPKHEPEQQLTPISIQFNTIEDIYDFILMDPLVSPCMKTTRLKQAISSIQLFIHRILMGLEGDALYANGLEDTLAEQWQWKKNYRVWEAHQKVLLYPENWIEPELRDNKTPFFEEFESKLSQSEIDDNAIETAFTEYIDKVSEVSNLMVVTFKEQITTDDDGSTLKTLHVLGQTREKPSSYYYRRRENSGVWQPWQKVGLDIDSDVILMAVYNGLPYLFWPTIKEKTQKLGQDNDADKNNDTANYRPGFEITFNWSCHRNGRWEPKKKTDSAVTVLYDWSYFDVVDNPADLLSFHIYTASDVIGIQVGMLAKNTRYVEKYTWNEDKLSEILMAVKNLPTEIDWEYLMPGWDLFKDNTVMTKDKVDLIKESVNSLIEFAEKQIKINLHAQPHQSNPFSFIRSTLLTGYANVDISQGGVVSGNELLWQGLLGIYLSVIPSICRNSSDLFGPRGSDLTKINNALMKLYDLHIEAKEYIELTSVKYRHMIIDENKLKNNYLVVGAEVLFAGYKLKPRVYNSLGLLSVDDEMTSTGEQAQVRALPVYYSFNHYASYPPRIANYQIRDNYYNSAYSYKATLNKNQTEINYIEDHQYRTELIYSSRYRSRDYHLFRTNDQQVRLTPKEQQNFVRYFYADTKYSYLLEHNPPSDLLYSCTTFYHPFIDQYARILHNYNIKDTSKKFELLLQCAGQNMKIGFPLAVGDYSDFHWEDYTFQNSDYFEFNSFSHIQPFGIYNWEIFFHMPFTIAVRLSQNKKFEQAQQWFHYIFNPFAKHVLDDDPSTIDEASRYWNFLPFHNNGVPDSVDIFSSEFAAECEALARDPFEPHLIARMRIGAYQRAVVMKYLDNLIAWGDYLFDQDTIESINEATHLYILAYKILGKRPKIVPQWEENTVENETAPPSQPSDARLSNLSPRNRETQELETVVSLQSMDSVHNAIASDEMAAGMDQIFSMLWYQGQPPVMQNEDDNPTPLYSADRSVFCVPHNAKLIQYWDIIANRLFKIRHCMNIEGVVRELPIFEPPIDPGLLVRGSALGIDIGELVASLHSSIPYYRFKFMLQKAHEFCSDVKTLGAGLLAALEKNDAESLSILRSSHEQHLLSLVTAVKTHQVEEATETMNSLRVAVEKTQKRFEFYNSRSFENSNERSQVSKLSTANDFNIASQVVSMASSIGFAIPQIHMKAGFPPSGSMENEYGGQQIGNALTAMSRFLGTMSAIYSHQANLHAIQGSRERRMDDWKFQAQQAEKEIQQLNKQLLAAEIKVKMAEKDLSNHEVQMEQADELKTFMEQKYTNQQLYHWMSGQISSLYFQSYKMAVDLARQAQRAYANELGVDTPTFISGSHWNNLKKGLMAGEKLQYELRHMEKAYLDSHQREYELTKHLSLKALDPAQLDMLRYTGECYLHVPELIFDLDFPGHYCRRIKSVSISIPSVTGPYTGTNVSLTLEKSWTRKTASISADDLLEDNSPPATRAVSFAQNGSGLFEVSYDDQRLLPFEYCGAVSRWKVSFNSPYQQFDHATIPDVILHMNYTAKAGDESFAMEINDRIAGSLNTLFEDIQENPEPDGLALRLDLRREFPDAWHRFISEDTGNGIHAFTLPVTKEHFPYLFRPFDITVNSMSLFCLHENNDPVGSQFQIAKLLTSENIALSCVKEVNNQKFYNGLNIDTDNIDVEFELAIEIDTNEHDIAKLKEIVVILHVSV